MAIVKCNPILNGFHGCIGNLVFRQMYGRTVVSSKPSFSRKQTEKQRKGRNKFKYASSWAKHILVDPEKKVYYNFQAKERNLPNAYTAAIQDYMRNNIPDSFQIGNAATCDVKQVVELKAIDTTPAISSTSVKNDSMHVNTTNASSHVSSPLKVRPVIPSLLGLVKRRHFCSVHYIQNVIQKQRLGRENLFDVSDQ